MVRVYGSIYRLAFVLEIRPSGPITCGVNKTCYEFVFRNQIFPALHSADEMHSTIFMLDGTPPRITTLLK